MYTHSTRIARSVVLGIVFLTGTDGVRADPSTGHEVVERRTERSLTWLNADGTYTLRAYTRPIHFRAKNGTWQQIETDIKPTEKAGFTWSGERNSLRAYLPRKADGWTRVEAGDGALLFRPAAVSTGEFATKGNKAYLRQAWSGTTLSYYVAPGCLKEQMTLYGRDAPSSFSFDVKLQSLTAKKNDDNSISLISPDGNVEMEIPTPWMRDAAGIVSTAIGVAFKPTIDGFTYTLTPDHVFLREARYPVVVDPTFMGITPGFKVVPIRTLPTIYAYSGVTEVGDWSGPYLRIGEKLLANGSVEGYRSVLNFGHYISDLGIPPTAEIQQASLSFSASFPGDCYWYRMYCGNMNPLNVQAHDVSALLWSPSASMASWNSVQAAWDPDGSSSPPIILPIPTNPQMIPIYEFSLDVKTIIQKWVLFGSGTPNILVRETADSNDAVVANWLTFFPNSSDCLKVTYAIPTYSVGPAIEASISTDDTTVPAGSLVNLRVVSDEDGNDSRDMDTKYLDGIFSGEVQDRLARAVWSVSVGSVFPSETVNSLDQFHAVWDIPTGTPPGTYSVAVKVYDEGRYGPGSVDSADPDPYTARATVDVGDVTYVPSPPISASILASSDNVAPDGQITLQAVSSGSGTTPATDLDSKYINGVFVGQTDNSVVEVSWAVTDSSGTPRGILTSATGMQTVWTAPSEVGTYFVTMTVNDDEMLYAEGRDDAPVILTKTLTVGSSGATTPQMTEASVVSHARNFCQSIGAPNNGSAQARYPALNEYVDLQNYYWQPRWRVTFEDGAEVEVVDATGLISMYTHLAATSQLMESGQSSGPEIPESQALQKAAFVLAASGYTGEIASPTAHYQQILNPPKAAGQLWTVIQPRQHQAIPFRDQHSLVVLQGTTGDLLRFSLDFPTPVPVSTAESFSSLHARTVSEATLAAVGIQNVVWQDTQKHIVQPNTFWQDGSLEPQPGVSRVAWSSRYAEGDMTHELWVDTETGNVIGGATSTLLGRRGPPSAESTTRKEKTPLAADPDRAEASLLPIKRCEYAKDHPSKSP